MRRIATVWGSLATAGALTLGLAGSAWAASGTLAINGQQYRDPSGCYNSDIWPLRVGNYTDTPAFVYDGPDCDGSVVAVVHPGDHQVNEQGQSVSID
jgi:hypothetical protein